MIWIAAAKQKDCAIFFPAFLKRDNQLISLAPFQFNASFKSQCD
jgi:hypothetical protein